MFVILVIACSEVAIVMTYFQLCGEVRRIVQGHKYDLLPPQYQ